MKQTTRDEFYILHINLTELKKLGNGCLIVIVSAIILIAGYFIVTTPIEEYSSTMANTLRMELNDGNPEYIEYYKEKFIDNDRYLFDGPKTFELMGEKYGVSGETLMDLYEKSTCESAQEFHDTYVVHAVKAGLLR